MDAVVQDKHRSQNRCVKSTVTMSQGSKSEKDNRPRRGRVGKHIRCTVRAVRARYSGTVVSMRPVQVMQVAECIAGGQRAENKVRRGHSQPTGSQQGSGLAQESSVRVRALNRVPSEVRDGRSQASARRGWETKSNRAKASKV